MSVSPLAAPSAPTLAPVSPAAPAASAPPIAGNPAIQVSLSAEAELSLTVYQRTTITVSMSDASGSKNPAKGSADAQTAHALATLESVADAQRAWIKALEAKREGRPAPKAQDAQGQQGRTGGAKSDAGETDGPSVQISVEQETVIDASLTVGAQVDVST